MQSIRTRLGLSFAAIIIVTLGLFLAAIHITAASAIKGHVGREMQTSMAMFRADWARQERQMRQSGQVLAHDFGFRAAVATGDRATTESALANIGGRFDLAATILIDDHGVVAAHGPALTGAERQRLIADVDGPSQGGLTRLGGQDMLAVAVPVNAPMPVGWLVVARPMGARQMEEFGATTSIALTARIVDRASLLAMRIPPADTVLAQSGLPGIGTLSLATPLPAFGYGPSRLLLLEYPMMNAAAFFRQAEVALGLIGVSSLIAALLASWYLARDITRPLLALRDAAARMSAGEVAHVQIESGNEIGDLAGSFNKMVTAVTEREARISHLYALASQDAMTGLPNRTVLHEALTQALLDPCHDGAAGLFYIDIDGFKQVNDRLGHGAGDMLIGMFATRCTAILNGSLLARLGGDEFAAMVTGDWLHLRAAAQALVDGAAQPFAINGHAVQCGASIGIALLGIDGHGADRLLHHADLALYAAKAAGKGRFCFYREGQHSDPAGRGEATSPLVVI